MPPLPELRVAALADLATQLRFAPREKRLEDVERIERLAADVDPDVNYPEEWIEFRVTGLRRDLPEAITVTGAALLSDLSSLAERLCEQIRLGEDELRDRERSAGREPPTRADELAERWSVSRKTVDRYRKRGLIGRRVRARNGKPRIVFTASAIAAFEASERERLDRAGGFTRLDPATELAMLRRAARYRETFGCTLNQTAERLAERYNRSLEGVRQVLRRHDASGAAPIFDDPGPLTPLQRRMLLRAHARGIEPGVIARRYRRTVTGVVRATHLERARRLWRCVDTGELYGPTAPVFERDDAPEVLLSHASVRAIPTTPSPTTIGGLVALARATPPTPASDEAARLVAMHFCRARALAIATGLDREQPEARAVDLAETSIRWWARLRESLVRAQLGLVIATIERRMERPSEAIATGQWLGLWDHGVLAARRAVEGFDPARGGRLAAPVGLAVDRALSRVAVRDRESRGRAGALLRLDERALGDWRPRSPLDATLWPDRRLVPRGERDGDEGWPAWWPEADEEARRLFAWRHGFTFDGVSGAPATLDEIGERLGTGRAHIPRRVRAGMRALLVAARAVDSA